MCRFMVFYGESPILMADLIIHPEHSIIHQSHASRERRVETTINKSLNGDGFGLGWYSSAQKPCVFTQITPAWNNINLHRLSDTISSNLVFAHVRASTDFPTSEENCHPFQYGPYMFMHNGGIAYWRKISRTLRDSLSDEIYHSLRGSTDSELCFGLFLQELPEGPNRTYPPYLLLTTLLRLLAKLRRSILAQNGDEVSLLNFAVTDGSTVLVSRFKVNGAQSPSLYYACGSSWDKTQDLKGDSRYQVSVYDARVHTVIISSEPLSDHAGDWVPVPEDHILIITPQINALFIPIMFDKDGSPVLSWEKEIPSLVPSDNIANGSTMETPNVTSSPVVERFDSSLTHTISNKQLDQGQPYVLCLLCVGHRLFCGMKDGSIRVWDLRSYLPEKVLTGHTSSVVALENTKGLLVSSSRDHSLRLWCLLSFETKIIISHLPSVALSLNVAGSAIICGLLNTQLFSVPLNLQHYQNNSKTIELLTVRAEDILTSFPTSHYGAVTAISSKPSSTGSGSFTSSSKELSERYPTCNGKAELLHSNRKSKMDNPNYNVYSGSVDGLIFSWELSRQDPTTPEKMEVCLLRKLTAHEGGVMSLKVVKGGDFLLSGGRDGRIKVWCLRGKCTVCMHVLPAHQNDVMGITVANSIFCSASADHNILLWRNESFLQTHSFLPTSSSSSPFNNTSQNLASVGSLLCIEYDPLRKQLFRATVGSPQVLCLDLSQPLLSSSHSPKTRSRRRHFNQSPSPLTSVATDLALIWSNPVGLLATFVAIQTVSHDATALKKREECVRGCVFLRGLLDGLGAETKVLYGDSTRNPVLFARLSIGGTGGCYDENAPTVAFYGHYDVQPAPINGWNTDPFSLTSINGFLYGRGSSDNKGPIIALLAAVHRLISGEESSGDEEYEDDYDDSVDLYSTGLSSPINLVFIYEGEEETDSEGTLTAVKVLEKEGWFVGSQVLVVTNTQWIDDVRPCLVYGLRGVLHFELHVNGEAPHDLHSGTDGGAIAEPMIDLMAVLCSFFDHRQPAGCHPVQIEGFYDNVREALDPEERSIFEPVTKIKDAESLTRRWRYPALSVHGIDTSVVSRTIIPSRLIARFSIRTVPDQDTIQLVKKIEAHIEKKFVEIGSRTTWELRVVSKNQWWLGDFKNEFYRAAHEAIEKVWGMKPLYIREGGSIPIVPLFSNMLRIPAVHIPLVQASDNAHLPNERIRLLNLKYAVLVLRHFLKKFSGRSSSI